MYVNETTILCVSPRVADPSDYYREEVKVSVAMNGQDFNDMVSDAYVTFVGTGSPINWLKTLIVVLLLGLLILAITLCIHTLKGLSVPAMMESQ